MYSRFYRWAMDRLNENGIIAFITNRSFIDSRTFDGFRRVIQREFDHAYIIDTRSDVRANPRIAGTTHNVFGIQTGVAIMFLVRTKEKEIQDHNCRIEYTTMEDVWRKEEKLEWLRNHKLENIPFTHINPDKNANWLNLSDNDWESLLPVVVKGKKNAIFSAYSIGSNTARDEWAYDFTEKNLHSKIRYLMNTYNQLLLTEASYENDKSIKWTRGLKQKFDKKTKIIFDSNKVTRAFYRPFAKQFLYHSGDIVEMPSLLPKMTIQKNLFIIFSGSSHTKPFQAYLVDNVFSFDFLEKTTGIPLFVFDKDGNSVDNITEWGLQQFIVHYKNKNIAKEDIFLYTYAVLHHPAYRKKYELNLKREFPRLPFYEDLFKWVDWGKALMDLHINYETAKPYDLKLHQHEQKVAAKKQKEIFTKAEEPEALYARQPKVKTKLKADKQAGIIELDELSFLTGVPKEAWDYKLGNRSALEWILDQYKEKKPKDPTIAEKFNTYRFADYKDKVIDLLKRVCTVSVETMKIVKAMPEKIGEIGNIGGVKDHLIVNTLKF
jgi:predicted helicase